MLAGAILTVSCSRQGKSSLRHAGGLKEVPVKYCLDGVNNAKSSLRITIMYKGEVVPIAGAQDTPQYRPSSRPFRTN